MPNWGGGLSGAITGAKWGGPVGAGIGGVLGLFKKKSATGPSGDYGSALSGYQDFAKTGGFTPQNIQDIRARSVSPIRSIYQRAQQGLSRQRALQGGYSPGYSTAMARMAREQSSAAADASTNAEAGIAEMQQKGKLAGLQGISGLYNTRISNPSDYMRKMGSIGKTMDIAGKIGGSLSKIFG